MATRRLIEVDITDRGDGKVPSWDDATGQHVYINPATVAGSTPPTFVAAGAQANGTGDVTPALYTGHTLDDILVLAVQSNNQTAAAPAGWTRMGPAAGIGTAAAAGATRLTMFWKRHDGSETDPTVTDTGDHTLAFTFGIRGCPTSGDPFRNIGATRKVTASTTSTGSAGATPADNCMIVQLFATALDTGSAAFSSPTNATLSSVTERADVATTDGNGGGIGLITGVLATAGSFDATTATVSSTTDVGLAFCFLPSGFIDKGNHIDRQIFFTAGYADTWVKPSGAKQVDITAIGGAASGSAGRNAATAAGGGAGGGGGYQFISMGAGQLPSTLTVTAGAGGAATANVDGTASNAGAASTVNDGIRNVCTGAAGGAAGASSSGSGGNGGNGAGFSGATAQGVAAFGSQVAGGGTGGTTANPGNPNGDFGGGGGGGGGTTQAGASGGSTQFGGAGGGGGRANTNVGTGGASLRAQLAGGASASANGADSPYPEYGGSGGAGGTSASGAGGTGGWPGGGGGGGGSQSGAQGGGKGGDGDVVIVTLC